MRVNVYSRGSNPRIDRRILRKSASYALEQVEKLLADWVDPDDWSKGIVAREYLPSEKHTLPTEADNTSLGMPHLKFIPPPGAKDVMGMVRDRNAQGKWNWEPEADRLFEQMAQPA